MEKGKLIWSFDLAMAGTQNTTEVNVDALTGGIVNIETETPESEAKEADGDSGEKQKGDKENKD